MPAIFVSDLKIPLSEWSIKPFSSERELQDLVMDHPEILVGDIESLAVGPRWVLIDREFRVPDAVDPKKGRLDLLYVDENAIPTLVEVKLKRNREIRRTVVGQVLDYGVNLLQNIHVVDFRPELSHF